MKGSARIATILIFLFFLFFNGVQIYLILQRIAGAKAKYNTACTSALQSTLFQYNRIKGTDTVPKPKQALIAYSKEEFEVKRIDSQHLNLGSSGSPIRAQRIDPAAIESFLNRPRPSSSPLDLKLIDSLYAFALDSINVNSGFRLDTFSINPRRSVPEQIDSNWALNRTSAYPFSTNPQRMFFYPSHLIFAELKYDFDFFWNDLFWPMLAFFFILLISNTALVFVYRTIRKQKRINEIKTDFINNMTHEMKTPITIASAGLDALEHHVIPTDRTQFYLNTSKKQLNLLNDFVERILDAAVQDVSEVTLRKEKIDVHALFTELVQSRSIVQAKPVKFRLTGAGPVFVQGDRLHLETAFHNIIDNAIKYSGASVDIDIDIDGNIRDCTIRISDNGIGIPSQFMKKIFEKFFRVPQGDAQPVKGFGLGLYYVSSIVKKHGGQVTVHSKEGQGTKFIITLPKEQ